MKILRTTLTCLFITFNLSLSAHEGMWIPSTLAKLVAGDMKDAGLKLTAEDIYSINQSSLKDAIVHFGGGCTASVISDQGLILTNHHCGYSQIQYHSSLENDYLKDGFWASAKTDELQNPNLTATFVVRIQDVTEQMMAAANGLEGPDRSKAMAQEAGNLEKTAVEGTGNEASVKPFFYGNTYYMVVTKTYRDVRLVGAPPSSIGKFGGDTDNWEWPRHNADFSLFRIYANADNEPADYSESNIPYKAPRSLEINMKGLEPGDFTMVFGFPGSTDQFMTSVGLGYIVDVENPAKIAMRKASLSVIDAAMESSDQLRIQYASKQSRISNAYKKWIGQNLGLQRFDAVAKKEAEEMAFAKAVAGSDRFSGYANLPDQLSKLYEESQDARLARSYLIEFYYYGPEALRFAANFQNLVGHYDSLDANGKLDTEREGLIKSIDAFAKNYDSATDQKIMEAQLPLFILDASETLRSSTLMQFAAKEGQIAGAKAGALYDKSMIDNLSELKALLQKSPKKLVKILKKDPIYLIANELLDSYAREVRPAYEQFVFAESDLMQRYVEATMATVPDTYWPDANSTLRLTYGKMEGTEPEDGLEYKAYTTLDGIMQKYIPEDKEFDVPEKLRALHRQKDYGRYATDGELRVCFLGSNHTTGGNSGSPTLDADGRLVGLNFDRTWQSTMSDLMFNPEICRNIIVDIKYVLFVIDKYGDAGHLVDEMRLR